MARDCPDRQKGSDWRNAGGADRRGDRAVGAGDAVDREMEVSSFLFMTALLDIILTSHLAIDERVVWWYPWRIRASSH